MFAFVNFKENWIMTFRDETSVKLLRTKIELRTFMIISLWVEISLWSRFNYMEVIGFLQFDFQVNTPKVK